jgi:hypothetical protein
VSFPPYSPPSTKILERQSKNGQEKSHLWCNRAISILTHKPGKQFLKPCENTRQVLKKNTYLTTVLSVMRSRAAVGPMTSRSSSLPMMTWRTSLREGSHPLSQLPRPQCDFCAQVLTAGGWQCGQLVILGSFSNLLEIEGIVFLRENNCWTCHSFFEILCPTRCSTLFV